MKKFVIVSDSGCALDKNLRAEYDVEYIPMYVSYDGHSIPADLDWEVVSPKEYYDTLRAGKRIFTSQVPVSAYLEQFEKYVKAGYDVLSITCSSGLSASVKASQVAREEILGRYPEAKIFCVDALNSGFGEGILCVLASRLRAAGKTIEEIAATLDTMKMNVHQFGTVDDLKYLKMAGRISAGKAMVGALLNVKPIIVSNRQGENVSAEKVKGRQNSIQMMAQRVAETYTGEWVEEIFIAQAECLEDAEKLQKCILERLPNVKTGIYQLDPILSASCGPKTLAVHCVGGPKPDVH